MISITVRFTPERVPSTGSQSAARRPKMIPKVAFVDVDDGVRMHVQDLGDGVTMTLFAQSRIGVSMPMLNPAPGNRRTGYEGRSPTA